MVSRPYETDEECGGGERPHCPHCENIELRRQGRDGFLQRVILARLGLYPWECGLCRKIFMIRQRAVVYLAKTDKTQQVPKYLVQILAHSGIEALPGEKS